MDGDNNDRKGKAEKGILYNANYDKEIFEERKKCQELCYECNQLRPSDMDKRTGLINKILKRAGRVF